MLPLLWRNAGKKIKIIIMYSEEGHGSQTVYTCVSVMPDLSSLLVAAAAGYMVSISSWLTEKEPDFFAASRSLALRSSCSRPSIFSSETGRSHIQH